MPKPTKDQLPIPGLAAPRITAKAANKSDLPFGSEFSPSQIDLAHVLELAKEADGDWKSLEAAVRMSYFESHDTSDYNRSKLANSTKLGMIAYGIIDRAGRLTSLGEQLYAVRHDKLQLHDLLAHCPANKGIEAFSNASGGGGLLVHSGSITL